jgi:HD-like signal output (HDOD) protein
MTLTEQVNAAVAELSADITNNKLDLPSSPDIIVKVRALAHNDKSSNEDLVNLVKHDPNISGRIIKIANSALFGSRIHVSSVQAAVTRLGFTRIQYLITGLVIAQNFMNAKSRGLESYFNEIWQQSNMISALCYVIASQKTDIDPEQALLAGMVHNIGVLPIVLRLKKIPAFTDQPKLLIHITNQVVPKLYQKAGKMILDKWNFSPVIASVVMTHTMLERQSIGPINLDDIVLVACELNKLSDFTNSETIPLALINSQMFQKLWTIWDEAANNLSQLKEQIEQININIEK